MPSTGVLPQKQKSSAPGVLIGQRQRSLLSSSREQRRSLTIVGDDEADAGQGRIGWSAPLARALIGAKVGDERIVRLPSGERSYEILAIRYPE